MKTSQTAWTAMAQVPWRFWSGSWPWRALAYALVSAVMGLVLIVLLPLAVLTVVGLPLLGIAISMLERRRTTWMGTPSQESGHARIPAGLRGRWLPIRLGEAVTWRETGALVLAVLTHAFTACVLIALGGIIATSVVLPIAAQRRIDAGEQAIRVRLWGEEPIELTSAPWLLCGVAILACLLVGSYLLTLLSGAENSLQRLLYEPRPHEQARELRRLVVSRDALVKAQVAERQRLERNLHDGVQQELVVLATRLGHVEIEVETLREGGADVSAAVRALDAAQDTLEGVTSSLRDTVRGLHPAALTDKGLAQALHELSGRTSLPLRVDTDGYAAGSLGADEEAALYYAVNEGVNNAFKHSGAPEVFVRLANDGDRVQLTVEDHGRGGALNGTASWGTGLRGLRERMEAHGGSLLIDSVPGSGTRLTAMLPRTERANAEQKETRAHPVG